MHAKGAVPLLSRNGGGATVEGGVSMRTHVCDRAHPRPSVCVCVCAPAHAPTRPHAGVCDVQTCPRAGVPTQPGACVRPRPCMGHPPHAHAQATVRPSDGLVGYREANRMYRYIHIYIYTYRNARSHFGSSGPSRDHYSQMLFSCHPPVCPGGLDGK